MIKKVTDSIIYVGANDHDVDLFEGQYVVPNGMAYNSYVILDEKIAVMDTIDQKKTGEWLRSIESALAGRKPDYLVVQHMEPDHAASIEAFMTVYPDVTVVANAKTFPMIHNFFPELVLEHTMTVENLQTLNLGNHKLTFAFAPMVHWPEVMMTYDKTDKVLFSADAFGTFGALNGRLFADEGDFMGEQLDEARRYYTNIVGKYGPQVQAVLKKAAGLDIAVVCPLHGPVWRKHFGDFLEKYLLWSSYTPEEKSVLIAYASVYGHTENAANILAAKLVERGVRVRMYDTSVTPASYILSNAFRCSHLVFAATTYNAGVFVTMENLLHDIANHNLQGRKIALMENGSWAPTSGKLMREMLSVLKNTEFIGDSITIRSALAEKQLGELDALADAIANDIRPAAAPVQESEAPAALDVDNDVFKRFSYGVEVLTTRVDGKDYGCIINTAGQVASCDPKKITISVIKKNNTCDMVAKAGKFNISILTQDAPYKLFQHFGFQSGRDVDKFADVSYTERMSNGIRYIPEYTNAVLSCEVIDVKDVETQVLYIANVVEAKVLSSAPSCTYAYYHAHIKPKKNPAPERGEGYVCKVCGYFHEGSELPDDFVCPLCKHGKDDFEHVVPAVVKKQKGYICTICGHFEPCEGELPEDYVCPLCHHGREDFEPAEQ